MGDPPENKDTPHLRNLVYGNKGERQGIEDVLGLIEERLVPRAGMGRRGKWGKGEKVKRQTAPSRRSL
jgi:hypothetical protein